MGATFDYGVSMYFKPDMDNVARGLDGLRTADEVLKRYNVAGLLVGGLAKELWYGTTNARLLKAHEDVDVLVLSFDCAKHPVMWEEGVDWWIAHQPDELPTNGFCYGGLVWRLALKPGCQLEPGLYLCPLQPLLEGFAALLEFYDTNHFGCEAARLVTTPPHLRVAPLGHLDFAVGEVDSRRYAFHCNQPGAQRPDPNWLTQR